MINNMNIINIVRGAMAQLRLNTDIYDVNMETVGEELFLSFVTDWQYYELICSGGAILGINTEPRPMNEDKPVFISCRATA